MPISDIPIFSMLRTKMQWHQERQRLLAENVANADTPKFQPRDLRPLKFDPAQRRRAARDARAHEPGHIWRFVECRIVAVPARPPGANSKSRPIRQRGRASKTR